MLSNTTLFSDFSSHTYISFIIIIIIRHFAAKKSEIVTIVNIQTKQVQAGDSEERTLCLNVFTAPPLKVNEYAEAD